MRWVSYIVIMLISMGVAQYVVNSTSKDLQKNYQVILYTLSICTPCAVYETDIAKPYNQHKLAKKAPLQLVNMDEEGSGPLHLTRPITQVPTAIIFKNGKEVDRLEGLVEPFLFYLFVQNKVGELKQAETGPSGTRDKQTS